MQVVILAVSPLVHHIEVVEADQTVDGVLLQFHSLLLQIGRASCARDRVSPLLVSGDSGVELTIHSVILFDDVTEVLPTARHSHTDDVLG